MLKTARSHGKDPYDKKKEQREGGKKKTQQTQRMPNSPCGALKMSKTMTEPTKYQ